MDASRRESGPQGASRGKNQDLENKGGPEEWLGPRGRMTSWGGNQDLGTRLKEWIRTLSRGLLVKRLRGTSKTKGDFKVRLPRRREIALQRCSCLEGNGLLEEGIKTSRSFLMRNQDLENIYESSTSSTRGRHQCKAIRGGSASRSIYVFVKDTWSISLSGRKTWHGSRSGGHAFASWSIVGIRPKEHIVNEHSPQGA